MKSKIISLDQVEPKPLPKDITVQRLIWDWKDTFRTPRHERQRILDNHLPGCWYVNPQYRIHGSFLTPAFFFAARKCQGEWFRTLDRQFHNGWRNLMLATRSELERLAAFEGILIIDGIECDASNWNTIEQLSGIRPRVVRRAVAFRMVKQGDLNGLVHLSRSELQSEMAADPDMALFITLGITVAGLPLHPFYREIRRRCSEWHGYVTRVLGDQRTADFARKADWPTRMLVLNGTLVIDEQIFLPGLWPGKRLTRVKLANSPFGEPTVPPDYLGIQLCQNTEFEDPTSQQRDASPVHDSNRCNFTDVLEQN